ncbi:hypothetical protein [Nocardioides sp. LHG3406-4]|uniref:hypothetical protein n=1 Tax=Nocardioides sp. LHG3406-4 TaxID=2804575 RepID=UPI003CE68E48
MKFAHLLRGGATVSWARISTLLVALLTGAVSLVTPAHAAGAVDVVPPDTVIKSGPAPELTPGPLYFEFASTEPGTFQCAMDAGLWAPCETPYATTVLAQGPHTLAVIAVDAAQNADPVPATYSFTILPPTSEPATVAAKPVSGKRRLRVDVEPDWAEGDYGLDVQRRKGDSWRTVKHTRTRGSRDVRVLDLRAGTYRVVIGAVDALAGVTSKPVRLKR